MKRRNLAAALAVALVLPACAQVLEEVVVKVNDQIVTRTEYEARLQQTLDGIRRQYKGPDLEGRLAAVPQRLLEQMTEELLLIEKAKQLYSIDSIVDFQIENFMEENKIKSKEDLAKALQAEGLTMDKFRKQITMIFIPEFIKSREIRSKIVLNTEEINDYYQQHKEELIPKEQVELQEILILKSTHTAEQAKALYAQIQRELAAGKDFGDLATQYSEAFSRNNKGKAGAFAKEDLSSELSQPVFALKAGQVTPLLETSAGWYVFKVVSRTEAKVPSLEEARPAIVDALKEQKFAKAYQDYIDKLKAENFVRVNPKYV
jgi:parvulin-like peptidyl-prolyl isomerase